PEYWLRPGPRGRCSGNRHQGCNHRGHSRSDEVGQTSIDQADKLTAVQWSRRPHLQASINRFNNWSPLVDRLFHRCDLHEADRELDGGQSRLGTPGSLLRQLRQPRHGESTVLEPRPSGYAVSIDDSIRTGFFQAFESGSKRGVQQFGIGVPETLRIVQVDEVDSWSSEFGDVLPQLEVDVVGMNAVAVVDLLLSNRSRSHSSPRLLHRHVADLRGHPQLGIRG